MNILCFIKRNIQIVLSIGFILFLLIPNILLSSTINPINYRILCLALPASIYTLILFLPKKPAKAMLFLSPLIIFDVYQIFLIYMFGPYISGVDMILNIFSSDNNEAGELLQSFISPIIIGAIPLIVLIYIIFYSLKIKDVVVLKYSKTVYFVTIPIMAICCLMLGYRNNSIAYSLKNDIYPTNAFYNVYLAGKRYYNIKTFEKRSKDFKFHSHSTRNKNEKELYILLIGETSRSMNWQLYGYKRKTNPRLSALGDDLLIYKDVLTQSNTTHKSVPIILSNADAQNFSILDSTKSIISAFKEAGFNTISITNQPANGSYTDFFLHEADRFISIRDEYGIDKKDICMLPIIDSIMSLDNKKQLIVLHSYGSHFNYYDRYGKDMSIFTDKKAEKVNLSNKKILVDTYDNAILSTDFLISEIIKRLASSNYNATLIYLADHGEDLFDDDRCRFLHATPDISTYQICIPFLIYSNDNYRKWQADIYNTLRNNTNKPFQSDVVFHSILSIAGIETPYLNKNKSLTIPMVCNNRDNRVYIDDRNNCKPIWSMTNNYKLDSIAYVKYIKQLKK